MWWEWHVCKIWQSKVPFFFVRWGYAGHTRLSDAIALLPSSKVASKHCRNMAQRFTLDLSTPENLWASSVGKTSEGLDWLGTLSIQEIKFKRSSVWQDVFDYQIHMVVAGLRLYQANLYGLLICQDYESFPAISCRNKLMPVASASPSSSKITVFWSALLIAGIKAGETTSLKKPRHLPRQSRSIPPTPEWPAGSNEAST